MATALENDSKDTIPDDKSVSAGHVKNLCTSTLGYEPVLHTRRSTATLLFQSVAIAAPPFAIGTPLLNAMYGGGPLSLFVGWIAVVCLAECVVVSIAEIASRYPTSAGPYYWSYQLASRNKVLGSFVTGWVWMIGNWATALGVNVGFAQLIAGAVTMYHPQWEATAWQLLLILWAILLGTLLISVFYNRWLHVIDTVCAAWTIMTTLVCLVALLTKANNGRHDAKYAFGGYDQSYSGWGNFTFFIGILPSAYAFASIGMISSMAEETTEPAVQVPRTLWLSVPVLGLAGLLFIIPICFTLPPVEELIAAPYGQALPLIFKTVMGSDHGGMGLLALVLVLTLFCSLSVTTAASRCTWAFSRDKAIPLSSVWYYVNPETGVPRNSLFLMTAVQALLGLINLGSSSAFTAFVSVGVMSLSVSYLIPIAISLAHGRAAVNAARFSCRPWLGTVLNGIAICWIAFQVVLFSMPVAIPTTATAMNYSSVVLVGFALMASLWYLIHARKSYKGPPDSDGIGF